jgi:geranylgeranyl diphosphate synthase type I
VRGPLRLGAAVSDASPEAREALMAYAEPLGLAFQLRDDVLGVFGSERETGKPVGNDLREGKQTALVQHAVEHLSPGDAAALRAVLGQRDASEDDVRRARSLIEASGALRAAEAEIAALRARCLDALRGAPLRPQGSELLSALATLVTERTR